jgi:uncharacterized radical SAM superfamily Fe-S cluster-containing enzyme
MILYPGENVPKESIVSKRYAGALPLQTRSLCPECKRTLPATIFEENNKVWIERSCPEHGNTKEVYWEDAAFYERARKFSHPSRGVGNPNVGKIVPSNGSNCPFDCGLCSNHHNHTALANIVVTNRCDLSCFYCFFYAKKGDPVYEPSLLQLKNMLLNLRNQQPVPVDAVQLTGGEPTLRKDLLEIVKTAREVGFEHIQLNTHGINIAKDAKLAQQLQKAGVTTAYLSFDGTTPQTNPKNHWEIPLALENLDKAKIGAVLVPTVIRGVNDHNLGEIINFGLNRVEVVRGINFQPVSLVGRMPKSLREKHRITIPGAIQKIEEQTNGAITREDFFPVPCISPITSFVEALTNQHQYDLSIHFACGAATYLFLDGKKVIPITQFVDFAGLSEYLNEKATELQKGANKQLVIAKTLVKIGSFVDQKKQPKQLNLAKLLYKVLIEHSYTALGRMHEKSLFVGMMHFMDPYLYDQMRVERCDIHYAMPDGRIIPFCAFNVIPELYRDKVQSQYSHTPEEWQKSNPGVPLHAPYKRNQKELENAPEYRKAYQEIYNYFEKKPQ